MLMSVYNDFRRVSYGAVGLTTRFQLVLRLLLLLMCIRYPAMTDAQLVGRGPGSSLHLLRRLGLPDDSAVIIIPFSLIIRKKGAETELSSQ